MKIKTQEIKKNIIKSLKLSQKEKDEENGNFKYDSEEEQQQIRSDDDEQSLDSDQELQLAFARKQLTPGLNIQMSAPKEFVNDKERLERKYKDFYLDMEWPERLDITVPKSLCTIKGQELDETNNNNNNNEILVNNDFKRESFFLKQAEESIRVGLEKLSKFKIPTKRPDDYFAEMAKSDEHMKKVRENLLSKHAEMERREKIRKLRELKKMGKQIQLEAEKKKQESKKKLKESIKKFKKGDKDDLEIELEQEDNKLGKRKLNEEGNEKGDKKSKKLKQEKDENGIKIKSKKALQKDKRYGFGGRKKRSKYNTADSYAEAYKTPVNKKKNNQNGKGGFRKNGAKKFANKNKPKKKF